MIGWRVWVVLSLVAAGLCGLVVWAVIADGGKSDCENYLIGKTVYVRCEETR